MIIGPSDAGKTFLACRIIRHILSKKLKETDSNFYYQQLFLMSPNYPKDPKLVALVERLKKTHKVITCREINKDTIAAMTRRVSVDKQTRGIRSFVYIDDPVGQEGLTDKADKKSPMNSFVTSIKHDESGLLFSTQAGSSASTVIRGNTDVFILLPNRMRRRALYEACPFVDNYKDFTRLMDAHASSLYHALWVNVKGGALGVYRTDPEGRIFSVEEIPQVQDASEWQ